MNNINERIADLVRRIELQAEYFVEHADCCEASGYEISENLFAQIPVVSAFTTNEEIDDFLDEYSELI